MATGNVVLKHVNGITLIKCWRCKALYSTDQPLGPDGDGHVCYEKCPACGFCLNGREEEVSLWRYNLIKFWRERIAR